VLNASPTADMTVKDALMLLGHDRRQVEGGPRSSRWRPRGEPSIEDVREEIVRKVECIKRARAAEAAASAGAEAAAIERLTELLGV
jgi:hypothetical protein